MGSTGLAEQIPDYLFTDGKISSFMDVRETNNGELNFIVLEGIGDDAWVISKLWKICQERDVMFYFNKGMYSRVGPYFDMMGLKYAETDVESRELLSYPGEYPEGAFDNGGTFYIHANRHIEAGKPLHRKAPKWKEGAQEWMPWLPFKNPAPPIQREEREPYIVVHMASASYCEGNLFPRQWARLLEYVEDNVAPVKLIGAKWDEKMIDKVTDFYMPKLDPCLGQPLHVALSDIVNSRGMIGVDSGLTIMATYYGLPALRAYPRWLHLMPGTFEDTATLQPLNKAIFMDEVMETYKDWCQNITGGQNFR